MVSLASAISKHSIEIDPEIKTNTEVVAFWVDAVKEGTSKHLRITETYTHLKRYTAHKITD